jgi:hypothetical protein
MVTITPATQTPPPPQADLPGTHLPAGLGAEAYLARLALLHDEAAETAHLANLLGRTPLAAGALGLAALVTLLATLRTVPSAPLTLWLAALAISVAVTARVYGLAIVAPFDRDVLKGYARNLSAILTFAGTVWGAGIALALPDSAGIAASILYIATASAAIAAVLRTRDMSFSFLVPAAVVGALCVLMRSFDGADAAAVLGGGVAVAGGAVLIERFSGLFFRAA